MKYGSVIFLEYFIACFVIFFLRRTIQGIGDTTFPSKIPKVINSDDYYSSLIGVQNLAKTEQLLVEKLIQYKSKLTETLELIDYYLDDYRKSTYPVIKKHSEFQVQLREQKYPVFKSKSDLQWISEQTSANPMMVFKLLRRFAVDLEDIRLDFDNAEIYSDFKQFMGNLSSTMKIPDITDLSGAAYGLILLQETYQLPTKKMGDGVLIEKKTNCKLLASDMLFIGMSALEQQRFASAMEWMYFAYQKILQGDDSLSLDTVKSQLMVARNLHNEEFLKFKITPSNLFSNLVNSNFTNIPELYIPPAVWGFPLGLTHDSLYDVYNFYALCRGERLLTPKMEMLHEDPPVFQVYELIPEKVINRIQSATLPFLKRAKVIGSVSDVVKSDIRTSSVAWLVDQNNNDSVIRGIPRTVHRATGLECESSKAAEELQVSCYGPVGGYYIPHFDSLLHSGANFSKEMMDDFNFIRGDRIATLMFYLSDVELGGGTAFPRLGVAARPIKGSAVIWYNLKLNGSRDELTLHGGCPVLYGNKWVANKWIRLFEQIHIRKCSRDQSE